eukprot:scaffold8559_cov135-Skeletonema_marinoi.AAC.7
MLTSGSLDKRLRWGDLSGSKKAGQTVTSTYIKMPTSLLRTFPNHLARSRGRDKYEQGTA